MGRMLRVPLGCRALALATLAVCGVVHGATETSSEKVKVSLFVPWITFGGQCHTDHALSLMSLLLLLQREGLNAHVHPIQGESLIPRARNMAAAMFLKTSLSHMLFVDADIAFHAPDVLGMLSLDKDVIAGAYPIKSEEFGWAFDGAYAATETPGIYKAGLLSTGFMLVARRALEAIARTEPGRAYRNNIPSYSVSEAYDYFPIGLNAGGLYQSEDFGFSELCTRCGIELFIYGNATLYHIGKKAYSANLHQVTLAAAATGAADMGVSHGLATEQTRIAAQGLGR